MDEEAESWLVESQKKCHLCVTRPSAIFDTFVFKHVFMLLYYPICRICSIHLLPSVRMGTIKYPIYTDPSLMLPRVT